MPWALIPMLRGRWLLHDKAGASVGPSHLEGNALLLA
jgi:hypothetical protein